MISLLKNSSLNIFVDDLNIIEVGWTLIPILIILLILYPSLKVLYSNESLIISYYQITLKVLGRQWFWSFSLENELTQGLEDWFYFNSYIDNSSLSGESFYNLKVFNVDNKVFIPSKTSIRILISRRDVIHSWSVPSLGVKIDAIPGRINQLEFYLKFIGVYFGQCTEICGINHSIIPFILFSVPLKDCLLIESLISLVN